MLNKLPKNSDTSHFTLLTSHFKRGFTRAPLSRKGGGVYPAPLSRESGAGFTIVELVVVIGTMALLFSLGYANYRDFQRRQQIDGVVNEFKTGLRLAQQLALTGNKPAGCTSLVGYRVRRTSNSSYEIVANCGSNETCSGDPDYCVKEVDLPSNITLGPFPAPGSRFMFQVLARGVDRDTDTTITFTQDVTGDARSVIVTQSGEIK